MKKRITSMLIVLCMMAVLLPTMTVESGAAVDGSAIVATARSLIGNSYTWGGSSPSGGFDCSGFVWYVFNANGYTSPTLSEWRKTSSWSAYGTKITDQSKYQQGDIVCYGNSSSEISHIGIYSGNGNIINALTSLGVLEVKVNAVKRTDKTAFPYQCAVRMDGISNSGGGSSGGGSSGGGGTNSSVSISAPTDSNYTSKHSVSRTNAVLVTKINKTSGTNVTSVGISIWDASGTHLKNYTETVSGVSATSTFFHTWFDVNKEVGITLNPNATYYYQFYATSSSGMVYGEKYSFHTQYNTYTVSLNANGGSVSPGSLSLKENGIYGTLPTPTYSGHTFNGWYTAATGGTKVTEGSTVPTSNHTLYAQWTKSTTYVTVSFHPNPPSGLALVTAYEGDYIAGEKYGELDPAPIYDGYTFNGWFTAAVGGTRVTGESIVPDSAHTLYAQWTKVESKPTNDGSQVLTVTPIASELDSGAMVGVKLEWTPVEGITYYRVFRASRSGGYSYPLTDFAIEGTSYVDVKIQPDMEYYYIVRPLISEGNAWEGLDEELGAVSNEVTCATTSRIQEPDMSKSPAAEAEKCYILMQIDNPMMDVNGIKAEVDPGYGTAPFLKYDRTMLPIRAVTEAMSGVVGWDAAAQRVTLQANGNIVEMWIGKMAYTVNGDSQSMDIAPFIERSRTMLPLRFVAANLNCQVTWINASKEILIVFYGIANAQP